ncbi:MAG: glutathione S-transferase family protein [Hyphomicrobiaceae bacterium]
MLTLFGNLDSGNVQKVQMLLHHTGTPFRRVDVRQDRGDTRDPRFLAINPMGKVPSVLYDNGDVLTDSGALLFYHAHGTPFWPSDARAQAEVLRWMFFEQYSHEPALAVMRYLVRFSGEPPHAEQLKALEARSRFALGVMDQRLATADWIAGPGVTIADLALYPYTRWMSETGLPPEDWPNIAHWLDRIEGLPNHLPLYREGAEETLAFEAYFGAKPSG